VPPAKVGGVFNGYAAGFIQKDFSEPDFIGTLSPQNDFGLSLTPGTETTPDEVLAYPRTHEFNPTKPIESLFVNFFAAKSYEIGYSGTDYADDSTFSATSNQVKVTERILWFTKTTYYESSGSFVSTAPGTALCKDCDFVKWGRWGSSLGSNREMVGTWIAGDIASAGDLNELGNQFATADYVGTAAGDVYKKVGNSWGDPVQETGRMEMSWDFAARDGRLDIYDFGGRDFGGEICGKSRCVTGNNHFTGELRGTDDLGRIRGAGAGSFVNNGPAKAAGVIGNFGIGRNDWKADGIFAGSRVPGQ